MRDVVIVSGTRTAIGAGGVDPAYMGLGPVPAIRKALKAADRSLDDVDLLKKREPFFALLWDPILLHIQSTKKIS